MEKKLQDYIHYYLGCQVVGTYDDQSGSIGYLTGVTNGGYDCEIQFILEDGINVEEEPKYNEIKEVKPLLRHMFDITPEEAKECHATLSIKGEFNNTVVTYYKTQPRFFEPGEFQYLLSKGFDLFELIENNLAIDKTKKL